MAAAPTLRGGRRQRRRRCLPLASLRRKTLHPRLPAPPQIADGYEVTVEELLKLNPDITNPDMIYEGSVIRLPCEESETSGSSITDLLEHNKDVHYLAKAVAAAGLWKTLADKKLEATAFAPTDDAFEALFSQLSMNFSDIAADPALLTEVLSYHLVPGAALKASDLENNMKLDTALEGKKLKIKVSNKGSLAVMTVAGQKAKVVAADLHAGKAVVHVVDMVLLPFEEAASPSTAPPTEAPDAPAPAADDCSHTVVEGDTLFELGQMHNTTVEALTKLNPTIENPDLLSIGLVVKLC